MNKIKKISISLLIATILVSSIFICNVFNDESINDSINKLDLLKNVFKKDLKILSSQKGSISQKVLLIKRIDALSAEKKLQELLEPLVKNSEELHVEMLKFSQESGEFDMMTLEMQNELFNSDE